MKFVTFFAAVAFLVVALQGCAVEKQLLPTGGSRADGIVDLSFEYGAFEAPQIDQQQGLNAARKTCAAWGYTDATAFGGHTRKCTSASSGSCNRWLVTYKYQCTEAAPTVAQQSLPEQSAAGETVQAKQIDVNSLFDKVVEKEPTGGERKPVESTSNNVSVVLKGQELLNKKGYNCGVPDGKMGTKTREAIKNFQRNHKIEVTGTFTLQTMQKLREL